MSLLHRQIKYVKSSANMGTFKAVAGKRRNPKRKPMGLRLVFITSAVLVTAAVVCYTCLLYLMPFANPKQILGITQQNYAAAALEDTRSSWFKNKFMRPFELRRTFLGTHQGIRAHYVIPEGMKVDLLIEHCMRAIIVEAYKCKVVGTSTAEIESGMGSRLFKFSEVGFYQFNDRLRYEATGKLVPSFDQTGYRIIWARD